MSRLLLILLMTACVGCRSMNAATTEKTENKPLPTMKLSDAQRQRITRFLFPLPHECWVGNAAVPLNPGECRLFFDSKLTEQEQMYVNDFQERWRQQYNAPIPVTDTSEGQGLTVIIAMTGRGGLLKEADQSGLINAGYLKERPNAEQAYTIRCEMKSNGLRVWLVANDASGLYYALGTLEQLMSGAKQADKIVMPLVDIVDWPDIQKRGLWSCRYPRIVPGESDQMRLYSQMKLNTYWGPFMWLTVSSNRECSFGNKDKVFSEAARCNIELIPPFTHITHLFLKGQALEHFTDIKGKDKSTNDTCVAMCHANPKTQEMLDNIFQAIVRDVHPKRICFWPSEGVSACHCSECKGDERKQMLNEIKAIISAYEKVHSNHPEFNMDIITTQGSYPYNLAMLDYIPKDVGIDIYSGSGRWSTYQTWIGESILPPSVAEMRRRGYQVGVVPQLSPSSSPSNMLFPFQTPYLVRERMTEAKNMGLVHVDGWFPGILGLNFNLQAEAEYTWNAFGRTPREFSAAWATRRGLSDPECAADIIDQLEYPERALSAGMRAETMDRSIERVTSELQGKAPVWGSYFAMQNAFEFPTHAEMERVLNICSTNIGKAESLGDKEFITGTRLLKQWIMLFERYTYFLENKTNTAVTVSVKKDIRNITKEFPSVWEQWIATQPMENSNTWAGIRANIINMCTNFNFLAETQQPTP